MAETIGITLTQHDLTALNKMSAASVSEAIRDIVNHSEIDPAELAQMTVTTHTTCTLDAESSSKIKAVAKALGVKDGKALRLIVEAGVKTKCCDHQTLPQKAIAGQASTDEITEYLIAKHIEETRANAAKKPYSAEEREMAIEVLMNKHHQCNRSHKLEVRDESLADADLDHAA